VLWREIEREREREKERERQRERQKDFPKILSQMGSLIFLLFDFSKFF
jgi:hypothetical protein